MNKEIDSKISKRMRLSNPLPFSTNIDLALGLIYNDYVWTIQKGLDNMVEVSVLAKEDAQSGKSSFQSKAETLPVAICLAWLDANES